jgi:integrase
MPETTFKVTLPHKVKKKLYSPSNEDIQLLYKEASPKLKKCIALGAYGGLRRGEISALTYGDLNGNTLSIDKDMVQNADGEWIVKQFPKTDDSMREIVLPDKVVELLGTGDPSERIVEYTNPGNITQCFTKLRNRLGIDIHFHLLRHFYASIGAVLGIPDNALAEFGGWSKGSKVMKATYQNNIKSMNEEYAEKMKNYFDDVIGG